MCKSHLMVYKHLSYRIKRWDVYRISLSYIQLTNILVELASLTDSDYIFLLNNASQLRTLCSVNILLALQKKGFLRRILKQLLYATFSLFLFACLKTHQRLEQ